VGKGGGVRGGGERGLGDAVCCHGDKRGVAERAGIEEALELSPVLLRHNRAPKCTCFTGLPQSSHEMQPTALFGR
jgi:hypothetical protein